MQANSNELFIILFNLAWLRLFLALYFRQRFLLRSANEPLAVKVVLDTLASFATLLAKWSLSFLLLLLEVWLFKSKECDKVENEEEEEEAEDEEDEEEFKVKMDSWAFVLQNSFFFSSFSILACF